MRWFHRWLLWLLLGSISLAGLRAAEYPKQGDDVFDPAADGEAQVRAGLETARTSGRRVLLLLGANWCPWCHRLDALLADKEMRPQWERDFVLVKIDVNRKGPTPRNAGVLERYRRPPQKGIPMLTVLDATGAILFAAPQDDWATDDKKAIDPVKLKQCLTAWAKGVERK